MLPVQVKKVLYLALMIGALFVVPFFIGRHEPDQPCPYRIEVRYGSEYCAYKYFMTKDNKIEFDALVRTGYLPTLVEVSDARIYKGEKLVYDGLTETRARSQPMCDYLQRDKC